MNDPFLITGQGRSGTLFLAKVLNLSPTWTVEHERPNDMDFYWRQDEKSRALARLRFGPNYGAVNSVLRRIAPYLDVRVFVIVRDPRDILRSVHVGRGRAREEFETTLKEIAPGLCDVMNLVTLGYETFIFESLVQFEDYWRDEIVNSIGITDIPWDQVDLTRKENASAGTGVLPHWTDWTNSEYREFEQALGWFSDYFGYTR